MQSIASYHPQPSDPVPQRAVIVGKKCCCCDARLGVIITNCLVSGLTVLFILQAVMRDDTKLIDCGAFCTGDAVERATRLEENQCTSGGCARMCYEESYMCDPATFSVNTIGGCNIPDEPADECKEIAYRLSDEYKTIQLVGLIFSIIWIATAIVAIVGACMFKQNLVWPHLVWLPTSLIVNFVTSCMVVSNFESYNVHAAAQLVVVVPIIINIIITIGLMRIEYAFINSGMTTKNYGDYEKDFFSDCFDFSSKGAYRGRVPVQAAVVEAALAVEVGNSREQR